VIITLKNYDKVKAFAERVWEEAKAEGFMCGDISLIGQILNSLQYQKTKEIRLDAIERLQASQTK